MSNFVTPMDLALAGLSIWRKQAQTAAIAGMRFSGVSSTWMMAPSEALERTSVAQAEIARASQKMSLALLEAAHARPR